jgi:hypothetical protein
MMDDAPFEDAATADDQAPYVQNESVSASRKSCMMKRYWNRMSEAGNEWRYLPSLRMLDS